MQIILYTGRQTVPVLTMLLLALIGSMPLGSFHTFEIFPMLNIIVIFYWTVYRPDLVPPVVLFLIGLIFVLMLDTTNIDPQNKCSNKYEKRQASHETKSSVAGINKINFHGN